MPSGADADYRARLVARRATLAERERRHLLLSRVRLAIVAASILVVIAFRAAPGWWYLLPLAAFVTAVVVHAKVLAERDRASYAVAFYERGLARLNGTWVGHGETGEALRPAGHPYADDLDIFGHGGLFELLATTRTHAGEAQLADWLLAPARPDEVRARQKAVRELAPLVDLRERIAVLGDGQAAAIHADRLRDWAHAPRRLPGGWIRGLLALLATAVVTIPTMAWFLTGGVPTGSARALFIVLLVEGAIAAWFARRVHDTNIGANTPARELQVLSELLETLETQTFSSARLRELQARLGGTARPASAEIARLQQLIALLESRSNMMFALIAALLAWATQLAFALEAWRARAGSHVPDWIDTIGEFEALSALAAFAAEHPDYAFPELGAPPAFVAAEQLAHPLLPASAVANDLHLGGEAPQLLVVSGSNMSGKSTLLRALGINVVLAHAGAPVRATSMQLSPLAVGASIRILDSLQDGRSRFYTEITTLKAIVDLARKRDGQVLFLLDEVLAGTNSHDRRQGADGLLAGLTSLGAIGLATTHDLALGEIAERLSPNAANVHFEDVFEDGVLHFDYQLRPGVVQTSNAIALMRSVGLDV